MKLMLIYEKVISTKNTSLIIRSESDLVTNRFIWLIFMMSLTVRSIYISFKKGFDPVHNLEQIVT